tara:strand:- start:1554 stop:1847 length:294 start_codon:yes stop_codon:yes gene_type:complete
MTLNYDKVWEVMNDLEEIQGNVSQIRATLLASLDYEDEETSRKLVEASVTQLDHYLSLWDEKFQRAWNKTVRELKYQDIQKMRLTSVGVTTDEQKQK